MDRESYHLVLKQFVKRNSFMKAISRTHSIHQQLLLSLNYNYVRRFRETYQNASTLSMIHNCYGKSVKKDQ